MEKIKVFAVTGGIGSGKSTVMEYIDSLGYKTISCDEQINKLYEEESVKKVLAVTFPTAIKNNVVDKKEISRTVFSDKSKLQELENFIHPLVIKRCLNLSRVNNKKGIAFIEIPLLFECGLQNLFDGVIVVIRDRLERVKYVKMRSGLSEKEIEDRIKNQIDYDNFDLSNYQVIYNNGDVDTLKEKIMEKIQKLLS